MVGYEADVRRTTVTQGTQATLLSSHAGGPRAATGDTSFASQAKQSTRQSRVSPPHGLRIRALIAVLRRGGLRISEALALNETDVDPRRGSLMIRRGKGDKRREAGMDVFGFEQLAAWLAHRVSLPPGPLFCVIDGATRGRRWAATAARAELRQLAPDAGVRRRFATHQLRPAPAVELARERVAINIVQRQLGPPTSAPRRHTSRGSIRARSSTPSASADRPPSRPPPDSRSN